jgi:hypothetical protein
MLSNDIDSVCAELKAALPWTASLDDARLGVLVNMCSKWASSACCASS